MSDEHVWRGGEPVEWVGADYVEEGEGTISAGALGIFIDVDGATEPPGIVVSFEPVGAFCCRPDEVRRVTDVRA